MSRWLIAVLALLGAAGCGSASHADSSAPAGSRSDAGVGADSGAGADADADAGHGIDATTHPPDAAADVPHRPYCGDGHVDPGEECDDGNKSPFDGCLPDCTKVAPVSGPPLTWKYFKVPGSKCLDGSEAGFGVNLNPASNKLMIYLEGGGACFNDACDFTAFSIPFVPPSDGIFSRSDADNPVKNWNMVYVPYCSGDIHAGDHEAELGGKLRYFYGYRNITQFLERWVPSFPNMDTVLLTGISAGGFGAALNFQQVADAFGTGPKFVLVDDSGPPLSNKVIPPCLQQTFRDEWGLDKTVLAACGTDCPDLNDFATGWIAHLAKRFPKVRAGVISNTADSIIRSYMGAGWGNGQYDNCGGVATPVPANVYTNDLLAERALHSKQMSTFYIGATSPPTFGRGHTALRSTLYTSTVVNGMPLRTWLGDVIDGMVLQVGP